MTRILPLTVLLIATTSLPALAGNRIVLDRPDGKTPFYFDPSSAESLQSLNQGKLAGLPMVDPRDPSLAHLSPMGEEWLSQMQKPLVAFAQGLLAIELLHTQSNSDVDVEFVTHQIWRDIFRLRKSVVDQLRHCSDQECVNHLNMIQSLFQMWLERIGANSEGSEFFKKSRNEALQAELNKYSGTEEVAVALEVHKRGFLGWIESNVEKVKDAFKTATVTIPPSVISRIWLSVESEIDEQFQEGDYKSALKSVVKHLAFSASHQDQYQLSFPQKQSTGSKKHFSAEWRYSEQQWWKEIKEGYSAHLTSGAPRDEFKVPYRPEYAAMHTLDCYPASGKNPNIMSPSNVNMLGIGMTALDCHSAEAGYSVAGVGLGPQAGITFTWGTLRILSDAPHLDWVSPEGKYVRGKAGVMIGGGGSVSAALGLGKVALLTELGFGMDGNFSGGYFSITRRDSDPESDLAK